MHDLCNKYIIKFQISISLENIEMRDNLCQIVRAKQLKHLVSYAKKDADFTTDFGIM